MLASQHLVEAAQAQDDVAPAFAARRPEIELADMSELLGQLGELGTDAGAGEAVENAELLLAQSLVDLSLWHRVVAARRREDCQHVVGSLPGTQVGRAQDDLRPLVGRHLGEPLAERFGLPVAERGQWDIDVSLGDGDVGEPACSLRRRGRRFRRSGRAVRPRGSGATSGYWQVADQRARIVLALGSFVRALGKPRARRTWSTMVIPNVPVRQWVLLLLQHYCLRRWSPRMLTAILAILLFILVVGLSVVIWSIKRHRDPDLHIECDYADRRADAVARRPHVAHGGRRQLGRGLRERRVLRRADRATSARRRRSVHFETFLWKEGVLGQARRRRAWPSARRPGVKVRVLLDANGSKQIGECESNVR